MNAHIVKSKNTRKKIVDYVIQRLGEDLSSEITYSKICYDLGISRTTLYSHFPIINDLYSGIIDIFIYEQNCFLERIEPINDPGTIIDYAIDFLKNNKTLIKVLFRIMSAEQKREANMVLVKIIHTKFKIVPNNTLSDLFLLNGIFGFLVEWCRGGREFKREEVKSLILKVLDMYNSYKGAFEFEK